MQSAPGKAVPPSTNEPGEVSTIPEILYPDVHGTLKARTGWMPLSSPHKPCEHRTGKQEAQVQILHGWLTGCVTLSSKSLNFSEPSFSKYRA